MEQQLHDIRCPYCNKKLADTPNKPNAISASCDSNSVSINIKCDKCKNIVTVELK